MRPRLRTILLASFLSLSAAIAQAEPALDHLPDDALGFVLIRNLEATNAKIEGVTKIFQEVSPMPIPAPLPVLKAATGLGEGLNEQGDALLALLPGQDRGDDLRPLLVVAVSDYAAFAASVNGDATGEVCRVTIAGEEILVAKRGTHAVLMNVEHRERLEALLTAEPKPLPALAPLSDWLAKTDVAAALTPRGVKLLTTMGQNELAGQRAAIERQSPDPQFAETLEIAISSFRLWEGILGGLGTGIETAAVGLTIDDSSNFKLVSQILLTEEDKSAGNGDLHAANDLPLAGFANDPYVFAIGGPVRTGSAEAVSSAIRRLIEAFPKSYGFENFEAKDWEEVEASWNAMLVDLQSASVVMYAGNENDPLYGNLYASMKVKDAAAYLKATKESMQLWNDLVARGNSDVKLEYEIASVEINGKKGIVTVADVLGTANDENVPMVAPMLKAMVGEDGKLRSYFVAADDTTVVMGISPEEAVAAVIEEVLKGETGLAQSSATQTTVKLLDPQAPWLAVVSPQGCVAWATRFMNTYMAQFGQGVPTIPEYPDSPPIGFSVNFSEGRLSTELVWPKETLTSLATYIKKVQDSF